MIPNPNHHTSLKMAQELAAAGIEFPGSEVVWSDRFKEDGNGNPVWTPSPREDVYFKDDGVLPAPSLSELLDELPEGTVIDKTVEGYWCYIKFMSSTVENGECSNIAPDACALMLIKIRREG